MLGGFHTVKYLQHRIEEYITGSELEEPPRQTRVLELKLFTLSYMVGTMCDQVAYVKKFRIHVKKITKFALKKVYN